MIRLVPLALFIMGCQTPTPKPKAQLALTYPQPEYAVFTSNCPYQFEYNYLAETKPLSLCGTELAYAELNATLYITYFDLNKASLDTLLMDFEKRIQMFGKEAFKVDESSFENPEQKVVGTCVTLIGDSPSNVHFFGTDTQRHYISGSLLFEATPNYDSLSPAIEYIKKDVEKLLESLRWN